MIATARFDENKLRAYPAFGPRYTSYPTAPQFRDDFGEAELRRHAASSNAEPIPRPISLYVHVPFCFSPCFYCGCNRLITRDPAKGERYLERLTMEVERVAPLFDRDRDVVQVHFGGGTPNFLRPAQLGRLLRSMGRQFHFSESPSRDFSIELDPRHVDAGDIAELAKLGFNRASLGVQDFNPAVQQAVNRVQSVEQTMAVIDACHDSGMRSINVDLIYGLPLQTLAGFGETLDLVIAAKPGRLAIYGYAHMPQLFKAQKQIHEADLPDAATRLALLALAVDKLTSAGYEYIGMDHFALPEDDLSIALKNGSLQRNFMGYTTHAACDLVGLGVSAISHIGDSFSQNYRDLAGWEVALDQDRLPTWRGMSLDADDQLRADVIHQLLCHGRIDIGMTGKRFNVDFADYFEHAIGKLEPLVADGLATMDKRFITATSRGRYLLRILVMCFDRYLDNSPPEAPARYSKAI